MSLLLHTLLAVEYVLIMKIKSVVDRKKPKQSDVYNIPVCILNTSAEMLDEDNYILT